MHVRHEATMTATIAPGMRGANRRSRIIISSVPTPTETAAGLHEARLAKYACHLSMNSAGTAPMRRPAKSLTCEEKMMTAMPAVKPVVTG